MRRLLRASLVCLVCLLVPQICAAQDNWLTTGILQPTVGVPLAANTTLLDYGNIYEQEAKPTIKVVAASSVITLLAIQRVAADGTTIIHEQGLVVNAFVTFSFEMTVILGPSEHLRVVNKAAMTSGSLWASAITN